MTDPVDSGAQKPPTRTRSTTTSGPGVPGDVAGTTPTPKSAATGAPPAAPASAASAGTTTQISTAVTAVRERLHLGEQLALLGAGLVVAVWLLFQVVLDKFTSFNEVALVVAVLLVLAIWVHRWGHHDFGAGYRVVVGALGLTLAIFAIANFLGFLRLIGGADALGFLGRIAYWAGGIIAGYGAWIVWRAGRR